MDQKIPFTTYDFWAYLSAGFLLLAAVDEVLRTHLLRRENWSVIQGIVAMSAAYAVGQMAASFSSWLWERCLVGRCLGYPRDVLFGHTRAPGWTRAILRSYFQPLPQETRAAIMAKAKHVGISAHGEALFLIAFYSTRSVPSAVMRLDNFLNLYGFSRNVASVALLNACALYWSYLQGGGPTEHLIWARLSVLLCVGMTLRYLKFYRLYANEVFTSYAFSKDGEKKP